MLTLHHAPNSVCSQKVRVGLALMGLDWDSVVLDLQRGDQFAPDYRQLNTDAVVPTLVDDGLVVTESSLILSHLDRVHHGGRLMPTDVAGQAAAEHWLLRCLAIHAAINTLSFATAMRQAILAAKTRDEIEAQTSRMPDPIMAAKRLDLILNGLASPYVAQAMLHLRRLFKDMQAGLAARSWLGGATPGIVDVALVAYVDRLDRLGLSRLWEGSLAIAPWLERWQAQDAYARGIADWVPGDSAEQMRAAGAAHWTEIEAAWQATA
ncbi:glutathione S-transferase family protein [Anianabacter salinae]|uniref:glutathione S-transferase family protein n=1 Tax=Anianabacter salinae TaxID=2851023 RepID=UPI00225DE423|nr:glutathione S-transferase family protein [Anianabacter salinae]MBV0912274.1 glutathione S-transferase family protein [Anianabacter salinae]